MSREEIDRAPHIGDDPFRVVSLLPGTTPSDYSAKTNIRGGQDNELLVLLDGQQLYNPFHLKDFLSSFTILDSRAIGGLDFLTGGFPAEYGNRMSGVIDVTTNGPASRRKSTIGVSLISVYGFSEGAYAGDRGHWLFSARDGFLHYLVKIAHAEEYDPKYYDLLGRTEHALTPSDPLSANLLAASDDVRFDKTNNPDHVRSTSSDVYGWLGLRSILGPKTFVETIASIAKIESRRTGGFQDTGVDVTVSDVRHASFLSLTQAWSWQVSDAQTAKFGFTAKRVTAQYDYDSVRRVFPPIINPGLVRDLHPEPSGTDAGAYVSDIVRLSPSWTADLGVRWDVATYTGSGTGDFSPRANLVWSPGAGTSVRLAWGLFIQPQGIYELQVEDGVSRFFRAQRSEHRVLSFEQSLPQGYSFRVEAYQKRIDRIRPRYESLYGKLLNFPETRFDRALVAPERADAKGVEIIARHDTGGRFSWWASYSLSKAEDRIAGVWYPRSWDQRHAVNLDLNYRAGQKWNFNASWIYHTGGRRPVLRSSPSSATATASACGSARAPYNALRLPAYHRLDLRVSRWFPSGRGRINAFLEVTNAYNRKNVCCIGDITVAFDAERSGDTRQEIRLLAADRPFLRSAVGFLISGSLVGREFRFELPRVERLDASVGRTRFVMVGAAGIEPATICSQSRYATAALRPVARIILRRK